MNLQNPNEKLTDKQLADISAAGKRGAEVGRTLRYNLSGFITDKQAAEILGVKPAYLVHMRYLSRQTRLPYEKRGGHIYYRQEDVEAFRDMRAEKKQRSRKKVKSNV